MTIATLDLAAVPDAHLDALAEVFARGAAGAWDRPRVAALEAVVLEAIRLEQQRRRGHAPGGMAPVPVTLPGAETLTAAEMNAMIGLWQRGRDRFAGGTPGAATVATVFNDLLLALFTIREYQRVLARRAELIAQGIDPDEAPDDAWTS